MAAVVSSMLVVNNTVFIPQPTSSSSAMHSSEMIDNGNNYVSPQRRSSIEFKIGDDMDNLYTLGDAIHEPELFLDKERSLDFLCVICQCICNTPYDIGCKNGHIYCKLCLKSYFESGPNNKCPQCQDAVTRYTMRINHFALRLLLKLRIFCPFNEHNCEDEKEREHYQCEWIGCYSDIIDHLKEKCKYGTFIHQESIQRIQSKYQQQSITHPNNINSINSKNNNESNNNGSWEISRAEITSYKVFWEQICDLDINIANHVNKWAVNKFIQKKLSLNDNELNQIWWLLNVDQEGLVTDNQFYSALHISRLHKNQYKTQCNLNSLYSLPTCLHPNYINNLKHNIDQRIGSEEDLQKIKESMSPPNLHKTKTFDEIYNKKKEINLDTKIGTMKQLKDIAFKYYDLPKPAPKTKTKNKSKSKYSSDPNWIDIITKTDIEKYKKWFITADENKDGFIDGKEGRKFFVKSKLSQRELAEIWSVIDLQKSGKLTETQFYAFFHIVMSIKKGPKKLPDNFTLPSHLTQENIIRVMNGEQLQTININNNNNTNNNNNIWGDLGGLDLLSSANINLFTSTSTTNTGSSASMHNNNHNRTDSIDSVHDWGDFNFDF